MVIIYDNYRTIVVFRTNLYKLLGEVFPDVLCKFPKNLPNRALPRPPKFAQILDGTSIGICLGPEHRCKQFHRV